MQTDSRTGTEALAAFAATLDGDAIPNSVRERAKDLFVDWAGSAFAGSTARAVETIVRFARQMGPDAGAAELLGTGGTTSPFFAAMVNAAASHVVEQDDVHNGSVFHPGTVVFPAVLAVAQSVGASGRDMITAAVAGYEVGIRIGEFLGRSHYRIFHTTGTVGTLAAAAAVGRLLGLDPVQMRHALGSAGTQSAGLWEFLRDAADSKQLHTAHAASAGLAASFLAQDGLTGAADILAGRQGLAAGMSTDADPSRLVDGLGTRWATSETSFKWHASCRHTHPAADALAAALAEEDIAAADIESVTALVHQGAIDVLGMVDVPRTVHQAKFSMGSVLGLIAHERVADLAAFETVLQRQDVADFRGRVRMVRDQEVDEAYPKRWIGKVVIETKAGRSIGRRVDEPKGDPGNTLSRREITGKAQALVRHGTGMDATSADEIVERLWAIGSAAVVGNLVDRPVQARVRPAAQSRVPYETSDGR